MGHNPSRYTLKRLPADAAREYWLMMKKLLSLLFAATASAHSAPLSTEQLFGYMNLQSTKPPLQRDAESLYAIGYVQGVVDAQEQAAGDIYDAMKGTVAAYCVPPDTDRVVVAGVVYQWLAARPEVLKNGTSTSGAIMAALHAKWPCLKPESPP